MPGGTKDIPAGPGCDELFWSNSIYIELDQNIEFGLFGNIELDKNIEFGHSRF